MKPWNKLAIVFGSLALLNTWLGFDLRFTLINLAWTIPIIYDWYKEKYK